VEFRGQTDSLSEIEFRTPYVVAERLIVALMLRFKPAKKVLSDTLRSNHRLNSLMCAVWMVITLSLQYLLRK
jgi:hypothetical protein